MERMGAFKRKVHERTPAVVEHTEAIKTIGRVRTRCDTLARSVATFKWVAPCRARLKDGLEATFLLRWRSRAEFFQASVPHKAGAAE